MTAPIHFEPTDDPTPTAGIVSPAHFDQMAGTLGAGPVETDGVWLYVEFNQRVYRALLGGAS